MENILTGNPLLRDKYAASGSEKSDLKVKRRWDDDVVFKNCARAEPDKNEKTFINDSLRSEFHRKFMDKYIKWVETDQGLRVLLQFVFRYAVFVNEFLKIFHTSWARKFVFSFTIFVKD